MGTVDYLVLSGIGIVIIFAIAWIIRRKRLGKSSCGSCPYRGNCDRMAKK